MIPPELPAWAALASSSMGPTSWCAGMCCGAAVVLLSTAASCWCCWSGCGWPLPPWPSRQCDHSSSVNCVAPNRDAAHVLEAPAHPPSPPHPALPHPAHLTPHPARLAPQVWYQALDRAFHGRSLPNFAAKVTLNQLALAPVVIAAAFAWTLTLQGRLHDWPDKVQQDFVPTMLNGEQGGGARRVQGDP